MASPKLMKIPQEVINRLIAQQDIVSLIGKYLPLKKVGVDFVALCPFHKERSPSFTVIPKKQCYYCFGCGAGGNAMVFLQDYTGKGFLPILMEMAEECNEDITPFLKSSQEGQLALAINQAMQEAGNYFENELWETENQVGLDYLFDRGFSEPVIKLYKMGYAGFSKDIMSALSEHEPALISSGVFAKNDRDEVYSAFRDRIVLPIRDARGKIIALSGRTLKGDVKPKYLNSKETALFSKNNVLYGLHEALAVAALDKLEELRVVEGQLDVVAHRMIGLDAVAAMGSSLSVPQMRLLVRHAKKVLFVYDGDKAGRKALVNACTILLENLADHSVVFEVATLPEGQDPDSMIKADPEAYKEATEQRIPWLEALFTKLEEYESLQAAGPAEVGRARMDYASAALSIIHGARDPLLKFQAVETVSRIADIPVEVLNDQLLKIPLSMSGIAAKQIDKLVVTMPIRLARMLWDDPKYAADIEYLDVWKEEGDELTVTMANWIEDMRQGVYDLELSDEQIQTIANKPYQEERFRQDNREQGAMQAFGNILGLLPKDITQTIMAEEPETGNNTAFALAMTITSLCAGKAMERIQRQAGMNMLSDGDREYFRKMMEIRRSAIARSKTITL
ncbi:DNA primase [Pseudomonas nitritireducens]|uniref:DNA primase n=1 Tax=Pseudomonas nitroreducens TaxID=46680 RepID=A0A7W7NZ94_PSENT|nr:DNA primase [Pseudomonas nitritireducens]MBB4861364.1 DNA primase [Pseudomonas nitritireducens]